MTPEILNLAINAILLFAALGILYFLWDNRRVAKRPPEAESPAGDPRINDIIERLDKIESYLESRDKLAGTMMTVDTGTGLSPP